MPTLAGMTGVLAPFATPCTRPSFSVRSDVADGFRQGPRVADEGLGELARFLAHGLVGRVPEPDEALLWRANVLEPLVGEGQQMRLRELVAVMDVRCLGGRVIRRQPALMALVLLIVAVGQTPP